MFNWANVIAQEEHCKDLVREAELDRLARQTRSKPPRRPDRLEGSLLWMRHQFVTSHRGQFAS